ncbi:GspE/PulE family protein [Patescibacteria group bacterium]
MTLSTADIKKIIIEAGFINEKTFDEIAQSSKELGKDLLDTLIFKGYINDEGMGHLIASHYGVEYANLGRQTIDFKTLNLIPEKMALNYRMVAFSKDSKQLKVALENPKNFEALEFVRRSTRMQIVPYYASKQEVSKALGKYKQNIKEAFEKVMSENISKAKSDEDLQKAAEKLPIIKILDTILGYGVAEHASDIHIEIQSENVVVRFRIDGVLQDIIKNPRGIEDALVARIKILSNLKIDERRIPQDGRYKFSINDEIISLRISIIPGFYGENVVMRILHESQRPLSLEELGVSGSSLSRVKQNIQKPHGMILVTGPTGSGKTTTLYSVLNILNTLDVKICTIEDPIEYGIGRVTQIQANTKTGLTFAAGLRALLRHDPDIIMVGEIRDKETAEIAVHAALTGHLVLSTLHTNTAAGTIPRLLEMGIEDYLLASTLNMIIAQRLVRKINPEVVEKYNPDPKTIKRLEEEFEVNLKSQKFYRGKEGQEKKPFKGRLGLFEVLHASEKVREAIIKDPSIDNLHKTAVDDGMVSMTKDGINKLSSGQTTIEEFLRVIQES